MTNALAVVGETWAEDFIPVPLSLSQWHRINQRGMDPTCVLPTAHRYTDCQAWFQAALPFSTSCTNFPVYALTKAGFAWSQ